MAGGPRQVAAATATSNLRRELVEVLHPFGLTEPGVTRF